MKKQCTIIACAAALLLCLSLTACGGGGGGGVTSYAGASSLMGMWEGQDLGGGSRYILHFGNTVKATLASSPTGTTLAEYDTLLTEVQEAGGVEYAYWINGTDMKLLPKDESSLPFASVPYTLSGDGLTLSSTDLGVEGTFVKVKKPAK